jgi:hypothetical protein
MAAIVEFTSFDRNAVGSAFKVGAILQLATFPNALVLALVDPLDGSLQVGDTFMYENGSLKFSATIKRIVGKSIQIDYPENWQQYVNVRGGVIYPAISESEKKSASSENQVFESAATILHGSEAGDSIETPGGTGISSEESLTDQPLGPVKEISSTRTLLTILGIVAGLAILTSIFNKSKKK